MCPSTASVDNVKRIDWVRFYPGAWREGTAHLSLEQEALYLRICSWRWDTGTRVPLDRARAAKLLRVQIHKYRKVVDELIGEGLVREGAGGLIVDRADAEYDKAVSAICGGGLAAAATGCAEGQSDTGQGGADRNHSVNVNQCADVSVKRHAATRGVTRGVTPPDTPPVIAKKTQQKQWAEDKTKTKTKNSEESPLPPKPLPSFGSDRAQLKNGNLVLDESLRRFWLEQFQGDEQRLQLALIQAAGYVQANSSRLLEAQVGAQLARIVADKRDRDQRYRAAADRSESASGRRPAPAGDPYAITLSPDTVRYAKPAPGSEYVPNA